MVAVPVAAGVKTPELLTDPMLVGLTDHVTEELTVPVPVTVDEQEVVCVGRMDVDVQVTETDVIAETGGVLPPPLLLPQLAKSVMTPAVLNKEASFHPKHKDLLSRSFIDIDQPLNPACQQACRRLACFPGHLAIPYRILASGPSVSFIRGATLQHTRYLN